MSEIPGFDYTAEVVCHNIICIKVPLIPYWDSNGSAKLKTYKKIKDKTAVMKDIKNDVNNY